MTLLLDTNVVSELRKAKTGKINPNVKAWAQSVSPYVEDFEPLGVRILNPWEYSAK